MESTSAAYVSAAMMLASSMASASTFCGGVMLSGMAVMALGGPDGAAGPLIHQRADDGLDLGGQTGRQLDRHGVRADRADGGLDGDVAPVDLHAAGLLDGGGHVGGGDRA